MKVANRLPLRMLTLTCAVFYFSSIGEHACSFAADYKMLSYRRETALQRAL